MKKMNKRGFTMAELLIVVAIIAVLVAIAIPIFTTQLEKSREGTDLANLRAAYAECASSAVSGEATSGVTYNNSTDSYSKTVKLVQTKTGWLGDNGKDVAGKDITGDVAKAANPKDTVVTVSVDTDGNVTFTE